MFSGGDIERLLEFALEVEGGLFSVNKETSRKRRGLVVFTVLSSLPLKKVYMDKHCFMKSKYDQ